MGFAWVSKVSISQWSTSNWVPRRFDWLRDMRSRNDMLGILKNTWPRSGPFFLSALQTAVDSSKNF